MTTLKITNRPGGGYFISVDGQDVSEWVQDVHIELRPFQPAYVTLDLVPVMMDLPDEGLPMVLLT